MSSKNEDLDKGKSYSDFFPGYTLDQELLLMNTIKINANMLGTFRDSLINREFDKDMANLMTIMYFNSLLGGYNNHED